MNEFNLTAEGKKLPEFPHDGKCDCQACHVVYERRKKILNDEIAEQEKELKKFAASNFLIPVNGKIICAAFTVAMAIFLLALYLKF